MSRYVDKDGKYVICSREDYCAEMERRQKIVDKAQAAAEKKAQAAAPKGGN